MTDAPLTADGRPLLKADQLYYPHPNELKVLQDPHRNIVLDAGRRWGKSATAMNYGLAWIMDPSKKGQMVWIILPQYNQAKSIYWIDPDINKYFLPYVQAGFLKQNDTELSLFCAQTNSRLILKGANNPSSLRGSGLDLIIWDEVADIDAMAFNIISPTLADSPNYKQLFIGTPDGYNHFHDFALRGDWHNIIERAGKAIEPDPDYMTYKFTSYDNMTWPEGSRERTSFVNYLNKEKQRYYEMGEGDWFEQEYMAEFRKRAGAVHKMFDRNIHVIEDLVVPSDWHRDRGWDWGSSHPTASIRFATDGDDNWFVETCYKKKDDFIENHAKAIKLQDTAFLAPDGSDPIPGFGDPSGRQWILELNNMGFSIKSAVHKAHTDNKTSLEFAIDKINSKIAPRQGHTVFLPNGRMIENAPSFFILNRDENFALVDELETLAYKKTSDGLQKTELEDTSDKAGHYDLHAAFRYKAVSSDSGVSFGSADPQAVTVEQAQQKVDFNFRDDAARQQAELEADLAIMRATLPPSYNKPM